MAEDEGDGCEGYDALAEKQRLKAALHHAAGRVCGEVEGVSFTRELVAAITETAFNQTQLLAWDLEAFAKHAKRTVVSPDDVRLCCRRSNDLLGHMTKLMDQMKAEREERRGEGRGGGGEGREEEEDGGGGGGGGGGKKRKGKRVTDKTDLIEEMN